MQRNAPCFIAVVALAVTLVAARRAPDDPLAQMPDACWIHSSPADLKLRASAHDTASIALDSGTVKVCYGRPRRLGRQLMGRLIPYRTPWRLGADEATAIHVPFRANIAGVDVEPGWYSIYAIPEEQRWQIVVNGEARRWGIPIDDAVRAKDVGSGQVATEHLPQSVEVLTIALRATSPSAATMDVEWGDTRVRIPVVRR